MAYKTPGVYVEEISTLPPSVAEVETAIPAFIGYTEKAKERLDDDLLLKPKRISSMLEYETYFGSGQNQQGITATVVDNALINVDATTSPKYLMYYSLQMYFGNGGGPCYIVSVAPYSNVPNIVISDLNEGMKATAKQDEPTLLLFPDATSLSNADDFYTLYTNALEQCNKLQDRFTIIDTFTDDAIDSLNNPIKELRDKITSDSLMLKYGAAYYPFINTTLDYQYANGDVDVSISVGGPDYEAQAIAALSTLNTVDLIDALDVFYADVENLSPTQALEDKVALGVTINNLRQELIDIKSVFQSGVLIGNTALAANPSASGLTSAISGLESWISTGLTNPINELQTVIDDINASNNGTEILELLNSGTDPSAYHALIISAGPTFGIVTGITGTGETSFGTLISALVPISGSTTTETLANLEENSNVLFNQIKNAIAQLPIKLPPSSSVAGIYARVDANSGVWTAPANVSLNYVIAPTQIIDNTTQDDLNVTGTGKSINAIRTFTGRGVLIWGARTLTGNSNEWRYVPVRRFFNFAEESIKKATEAFVFQSNDANTWVKVRGMIESFLTQQWKAGALTGAKTEQAFYVSIGLGQTMTAQDILEGRMIIEIGMAVVRPAEFIVLRFTHMMQEA